MTLKSKKAYAEREKYRELKQELGNSFRGELTVDPYARTLYATDASIYQKQPGIVAIPRDPEDLECLVKACSDLSIPLTPRGGGTSLAGQAIGSGVSIDTSRHLNRLLRVVPEEGWAEAEPGLVLAHLNQALKANNLMFAPDPATVDQATIGGAIANNSCGTRSILYGKTSDHVIGLTFFCGMGNLHQFRPLDLKQLGQVMEHSSSTAKLIAGIVSAVSQNSDLILAKYPKILRRVSGYNLDEVLLGLSAIGWKVPPFTGIRASLAPPVTSFNPAVLLAGSEGSLGLITRARLRLTPRPKARALLVSHYSSLANALWGNSLLMTTNPASSELLDAMILRLAQQQLSISRHMGFLQGQPEAIVLTEYFGDSPAAVTAKLEAAKKKLDQQGLSYSHLAFDEEAAMAQIWQVRKASLPLLLGIKGDKKPIAFVEDTAVDPSRLVDYVSRFQDIIARHQTTASFYAHASVGCLHIRPLIDLRQGEEVAKMQAIATEVSDLVLEFNGAMSGEHGDGLTRSVWNKKLFGPIVYGVFQEIKKLFDPYNIMNPGMVVDALEMTKDLRQGKKYEPIDYTPELNWQQEVSFLAAAELCNGCGVCRKTEHGTMCPSFMVTREEEHSTRGRANLLRSILTGRLPAESLHSKRLFQAMDLCISCKACKSECPSGVDMAKMKFEFLSNYYKHNRMPLRSQMFARIDLMSRIGSATAPFSNWLLASPLKQAFSHILGIAKEREYPTFARQNFWDWWKLRQKDKLPSSTQPRVVLFVDTFNGYSEPWVATAAVLVLERLGYSVTIADRTCCGRPMMSKGMAEVARHHALDNMNRLRRFIADEIPIIGLEPSCVSAIRDDYPCLIDDPELPELLKLVTTFEEFLQDKHIPLKQGCPPLLLHGHCHQTALTGNGPSLRLLDKLPDTEIEELDSGCCGMAGSFGYEKEHYQLSKAMAYRRLIPAAESIHRRGGRVVTSGFSCRHQLHHFTGKTALHPAEVLAAHLLEEGRYE